MAHDFMTCPHTCIWTLDVFYARMGLGAVVDCLIVCVRQTISVAAAATIHGFMACSQTCTGTRSAFFASVGLGAADGRLIACTQQATSGAVFAVVASSPLAAIASFYCENIQFLGMSDKAFLTNASVQEYRHFPASIPLLRMTS